MCQRCVEEYQAKTQPTAWVYELANSYNNQTDEYSGWNRYISFRKPNVPEKSIRNLKPLYTRGGA